MSIPFCKFHGFGNDYIVIQKKSIPTDISAENLSVDMCHRHLGAGADGIAVITPLDDEEADYHCEIINPDGSVAGFSGNGTRNAVAYLYYKGIWTDPELRLRMSTGIKKFTLIERISDGHYWFESEIGKPKFASNEVPFSSVSEMKTVVDQKISIGSQEFLVSAINVGNPVACIFVPDFDLDWRAIGREMESNQAFPEKANIVFVNVIDKENIELRIWERAVGETSSSGTCCSGAAILCALTGRTSRTVSVFTEGGTTEVHWRSDDEILITGRSDLAYCGEWPI